MIKISKLVSRLMITIVVILLKRDIRCKVPFNTIFNHGGIGVVIHKDVKLGRYCIIGQQVTLGSRKGGVPTIGWGVLIGSHSSVTGGVRIGCCSVIGIGSIVFHDIPPFSLVRGNPAIIVKELTEKEYLAIRRGRI